MEVNLTFSVFLEIRYLIDETFCQHSGLAALTLWSHTITIPFEHITQEHFRTVQDIFLHMKPQWILEIDWSSELSTICWISLDQLCEKTLKTSNITPLISRLSVVSNCALTSAASLLVLSSMFGKHVNWWSTADKMSSQL